MNKTNLFRRFTDALVFCAIGVIASLAFVIAYRPHQDVIPIVGFLFWGVPALFGLFKNPDTFFWWHKKGPRRPRVLNLAPRKDAGVSVEDAANK